MEPSAETDGCPSEAQLVHLASDEIADPLGRTRLEVHVAACPLCGARLREIRANQRLLAFIKRVEPPTVDLSQAGALRPGASSEPAASADHAAEASLAANPAAPNDKAPWRGYRLLELLHRGGQGAIHRALHEPTGRAAAMKVIRAGTSRERQRLWREAQLVAKLRHPNIVTVHDCGLLPGGGFAIAMELVEGVTLDEWRRRIDAEDLSAGDRVRR
ncbi:MAG: protein kinase, partial [Phycisphaerales bacterium]